MRVTQFAIFRNLTRSLSRDMGTYAQLNERLTTGKRISKPSDDILGAARIIDYRLSISSNEQYRTNMNAGKERLTFATTSLTSASDVLGDIRSLLSKTLTDSNDPILLQTYAKMAGDYRQMLADLANSQYGGNYLFSGFRSDLQPYPSTLGYAYQGDSGVINVAADQASVLPINVTGDAAFSYLLAAPEVTQISGGRFVHYTPGAGTTINVEIRDAADVAVLDSFSFSNSVQMADMISNAIAASDLTRVEAFFLPVERSTQNLLVAMNDIGSRLNRIQSQSDRLQTVNSHMLNSISTIEDADPIETAALLRQMEVTLQALHESAARVMSQSLLDFLR